MLGLNTDERRAVSATGPFRVISHSNHAPMHASHSAGLAVTILAQHVAWSKSCGFERVVSQQLFFSPLGRSRQSGRSGAIVVLDSAVREQIVELWEAW